MRIILFFILVIAISEIGYSQSTFIVTLSSDESDFDLEDDIFEPRTLRSAIENANKTPGKDYIAFVDVQKVDLNNPLPALAYPVEIDGYITSTDKVIIDGKLVPNDFLAGIVIGINADSSTIENLAVTNFSLGGLLISGDDVIVENIFVGTSDGITAEPNGDQFSAQTTPAIHIRGNSAEIKNSLISGNYGHGIRFNPAYDSMEVSIVNNIIGLDSSGTKKLGNQLSGILISDGRHFIDGNYVSANGENGIVIEGEEDINYFSRIQANTIGLTKNDKPAGNIGSGLDIETDFSDVSFNSIADNNIGIYLSGNDASIENNILGMHKRSNENYGNKEWGLLLAGNGTRVRFNHISGNKKSGISILSSQNLISQNIIGLTSDGDSLLSNLNHGIHLETEASDNTIMGNTISGNSQHGIFAEGKNDGTIIEGNFIGTDREGKLELGNQENGIQLVDVQGIDIGPVNSLRRNIISGNGLFGIYSIVTSPDSIIEGINVYENFIGTDSTGLIPIGNFNSGIYFENKNSSISNNLISANYSGIEVYGLSSSITGNKIGTDVNGINNLGNQRFGIEVREDSTLIGSLFDDTKRNIISSSGLAGIIVFSDYNTISKNYIGTSADGLSDLGNGDDGIRFLLDSRDSFVSDNLILGNDGNGIKLFGRNEGITIWGNAIGIDWTGSNSVGNDGSGIVVQNSHNIGIGLSSDGGHNYISSNKGYGIEIIGQKEGFKDPIYIQNNEIGVYGDKTFPNLKGGILFDDASEIILGGKIGSFDSNIISGNSSQGILITDTNTGNNFRPDSILINGNYIGTNQHNDILSNEESGIKIDDARYVSISSSSTDSLNIIAFNGGNGITISGGEYVYTYTNLIYNNSELGIDLENDGVTVNDENDADEGPNTLLNFPIIDNARYNKITDSLEVNLRIVSEPIASEEFYHQLYYNHDCDESGYGEGEYLIGWGYGLSDNNGVVVYDNHFKLDPSDLTDLPGIYLSSLSLSFYGTSEFSKCYYVPLSDTVGTSPDLILTKTDSLDQVFGTEVSAEWEYTITVKNIGAVTATNIVITDTLDQNLVISESGVQTDKGTVALNEFILTGLVPELQPSDSVKITIPVQSIFAGLVINRAYVSLSENDPTPQNNWDTDSTEVFIEVSGEFDTTIPDEFKLDQNYPNPFNPSTTINYSIPEYAFVEIRIFNSIGMEVATLANEVKSPGVYSARWDASNFASGFYIYKMTAGTFTTTKKMLLVK